MTTTTHTDRLQSILDRWATDAPLRIERAYEILPNPAGHLHIVDPDPDAQFEEYPVSLCGTMLISKDGKAEDNSLCETCVEILKEREGER